jgi:pectin methylesterase-like acyl-CoA thioesterase
MYTAKTCLRTFCFLVAAAFIGNGCSSGGSSSPGTGGSAGGSAGQGTGGKVGTGGMGMAGTSGTGGAAGAGTGGAVGTGGAGGATGTGGAAGGAGTSGTGGTGNGGNGGSAATPFVYFVKQANGTTTASLASGAISVSSTFGSSGNAFKYVAPNYYGTVSNGFISFPTPMTGDFSITAQVTITAENKANNACGVGLGMTTGFLGTDEYAYVLMRNSNNSTNGYYVNGSGTTSAGAPNVTFTPGTTSAAGVPLQLTMSRTGSNVTLSAGAVGGTATTQTLAASALTDGTKVFGTGAVYPAISFNNVNATITGLVIKDATGTTVFDSATGSLVRYVPASLTLSASTVYVNKGASTTVTATALAVGGAVAGVSAAADNANVVGVSVVNGATNSTITLNGLVSGTAKVTVTNLGDTNAATNIQTIQVSVLDFPTTDGYGPITTAYPAPGATNAYTDGELSLTFDAAPTLNTGGLIRIYKSDGTQVDSILFAGESNTFGTTAINVGSQLVRISGNTMFFAPHLGKLAYGTSYYVAIPTGAITGMLNGMAFNGLSNVSTVATWSFTTRAAPALTATITVDGSQSSTANFRTIQGALGAISTLSSSSNVTINVAAGTYNELVHYTGPGATQTVTIAGPSGNTRGDTCVQQYANGNGMNGSTSTRPSFYFSGANLVLENITLKNTAVRSVVSQAEALYFASGSGFTVAAGNSTFLSNQDTIQTSGRGWFYNCAIGGNVDFIWGTSDVTLVEGSDLHFINDAGGGAATYNLFVARTGATIPATGNGTVGKGYVALNSNVSVDANVTAFFGRDAGGSGFYDQAALVNVTFSGAGTVGTGLWTTTTAPLALGDSSFVGWKSAGCTGLNLATDTTAAMTSAVIANQATEYATRAEILNDVVVVTAGAPTGYTAAATAWDVSALATAWGAP